MGTLDQSVGSSSQRQIKMIDTTGYTVSQFENAYNTNYGAKGWRIIQIVTIGNKTYILAEREV